MQSLLVAALAVHLGTEAAGSGKNRDVQETVAAAAAGEPAKQRAAVMIVAAGRLEGRQETAEPAVAEVLAALAEGSTAPQGKGAAGFGMSRDGQGTVVVAIAGAEQGKQAGAAEVEQMAAGTLEFGFGFAAIAAVLAVAAAVGCVVVCLTVQLRQIWVRYHAWLDETIGKTRAL